MCWRRPLYHCIPIDDLVESHNLPCPCGQRGGWLVPYPRSRHIRESSLRNDIRPRIHACERIPRRIITRSAEAAARSRACTASAGSNRCTSSDRMIYHNYRRDVLTICPDGVCCRTCVLRERAAVGSSRYLDPRPVSEDVSVRIFAHGCIPDRSPAARHRRREWGLRVCCGDQCSPDT